MADPKPVNPSIQPGVSQQRLAAPAASVRPTETPGEYRLDLGEPEQSVKGLCDTERPPPADDGVGVSWDFVRETCRPPLDVRLRALLEGLLCLSRLHTDVARPPQQRVHGSVCQDNILFRRDGTAFLGRATRSLSELAPSCVAPEVRAGKARDQQADIYAVGVMLLEALTNQTIAAEEVRELATTNPAKHPLWERHAEDPLLEVARRATEERPEQRYPSARSFHDAIVDGAAARVGERQRIVLSVEQALRLQGDRATPVFVWPATSHSFVGPVRGEGGER